MEQAGIEESRNRYTSAFHEEAAKASSAKLTEYLGEVEAPAPQSSRDDFDVIRQALVTDGVLLADDEHRPSVVLSNHTSIVRDPARWIENDARRALARYEPRRQSRIIHLYGRGPDDDGVEQGTHSMRVSHVFGTRDERRRAARSRHASVEALAQMGDANFRAEWTDAERQIQVEKLGRRIRHGAPRLPPSVSVG